MAIKYIISQLENNIDVFKSLLIDKNEEEYLWRPQLNKWSLLEIVCHLYDEECDDFKARVKHTLEKPMEEMISINPEGWVLERDYLNQNYNQKVQQFLDERGSSIFWLKEKLEANWNNVHMHPKLGAMSARQFLANWLAHDYLHIRQIIRYQYSYLKELVDVDLQYAGTW